jgi:hypothetical protein
MKTALKEKKPSKRDIIETINDKLYDECIL